MKILTITINPALDKSSAVPRLIPGKKLRCDEPVYEPGGGGINVSRAIKKLGGESCAWFLSGGPTGEKIGQLLREEDISFRAFTCKNWTRENLTVMETSSGAHFRFGMPGPVVAEEEWQQVLTALENLEDNPEFVIASGSLSPGMPDDFYSRIAEVAARRNFKLIVDTSGEPLKQAAGEGIYLMKPSLSELTSLAGQEKISEPEQEKFAAQVIAEGKTKILVISMGGRGAMLATKDGFRYFLPPTVKQESTVGAGDSMVGAMVLKLMENWPLSEVVRYGVAAGAAATMTPGSELCRVEDTEEIYLWMKGFTLTI